MLAVCIVIAVSVVVTLVVDVDVLVINRAVHKISPPIDRKESRHGKRVDHKARISFRLTSIDLKEVGADFEDRSFFAGKRVMTKK